jgi:TDG/mug DNA glycosylase family protein
MKNFETLPDYLEPNLDIVSIGINPSLPSVRAGYYFANPRNRFWRALNDSGLLPVPVVPGVAAMDVLLRYGIGFTDVVKRPTATASELRAADYRLWAPLLADRLAQHAPRIVWFQGKTACANYLKYAMGMSPASGWGEQPFRIGPSRVFVSPSPSPANAAFPLAELTGWMGRLAGLRDSLCREPGYGRAGS